MLRFCLLVLCLFLLPWSTFISPVFAATVSTKLGIYVVDTATVDKSNLIIDACPPVLKVQDPQNSSAIAEMMKTYHAKCSGGILIMRVFVPLGEKYGTGALTYQNGVADADRFWDKWLKGPVATMKQGGYLTASDYISGTNEYDNTPDFKLAGAPDWYGGFWTQLATRMQQAGVKPMLGDIPEGNIDIGKLDTEFKPLLPALKAIKDAGGAWSYHSYGVNKTPSVAGEQYHALRYRTFYDYAQTNAAPMPPLLITEIGLLRAEAEFSVSGQPDTFKAWIAWFDSEMKKDSYVLGGTLFQIGSRDPQWVNRDISPIAEWLVQYYAGTAVIPTPPPEGSEPDPDPNDPVDPNCPPISWTGSITNVVTSWLTSLLGGTVPGDIVQVADERYPMRDKHCQAQTAMRQGDPSQRVLAADTEVVAAEAAHNFGMFDDSGMPRGKDVILADDIGWWESLGLAIEQVVGTGHEKAIESHDRQLPITVGTVQNPSDPTEPTPAGEFPAPDPNAPSLNGWTTALLVDRIRESCTNGIVRVWNSSCLQQLNTDYNPPANQSGIQTMVTSASFYSSLQCVGFVQGAVAITRGGGFSISGDPDPSDAIRPVSGAIDYAHFPPAGWTFVPLDGAHQQQLRNKTLVIHAGDILVFGQGTVWGHIADISRDVDPNTFTYEISEANYGTPGKVQRTRVIDIFVELTNLDQLKGFLRKGTV